MITSTCEHCGTSFQHYPHRKRRFCSQECHYNSSKKRNPPIETCEICGKLFPRVNPALPQRFCSKACMGEHFHRQNPPKVTTNKKGYLVRQSSRDGTVFVHREVMEAHLGRKLHPDEHVHHKNRDKADNRVENLEVVSKQLHALHHAVERALEAGYTLDEIIHQVRASASA